ncbi:MAG: biotin--[Eggerthellaceae bacterium]|nr:biotin--[acetyl-CoA-carboxylase] ligase [Eggerthellaceae bacterium]
MYQAGEIESHLRAGSPWHVFLVGDVGSTMDEVRRLASECPDADFLVAVAETQHAGLGRHVRTWVSTADGVWMTALLRPHVPARNAPWFTLAAAVAVAEALHEKGFSVGIKWPNDVLATDEAHWRRKLCGIRCEMRLDGTDIDWVGLGIGINVNHESFSGDLASKAASLRQLGDGECLSRASVAAAVLDKVEECCAIIERDGFAPVRRRWMGLALGLGEMATVRDDGAADLPGETTGIVRGLDGDGHLLLELPGQSDLHAVYAGDLVFEV